MPGVRRSRSRLRWIENEGGTVSERTFGKDRRSWDHRAGRGDRGGPRDRGQPGDGTARAPALGIVSTGLAHRSHCPCLNRDAKARGVARRPRARRLWLLRGHGAGWVPRASLARALGARVELSGWRATAAMRKRSSATSIGPWIPARTRSMEAGGLRPRVRTSVGEVARTIIGSTPRGETGPFALRLESPGGAGAREVGGALIGS